MLRNQTGLSRMTVQRHREKLELNLTLPEIRGFISLLAIPYYPHDDPMFFASFVYDTSCQLYLIQFFRAFY